MCPRGALCCDFFVCVLQRFPWQPPRFLFRGLLMPLELCRLHSAHEGYECQQWISPRSIHRFKTTNQEKTKSEKSQTLP
jgi:hypothetical protein